MQSAPREAVDSPPVAGFKKRLGRDDLGAAMPVSYYGGFPTRLSFAGGCMGLGENSANSPDSPCLLFPTCVRVF